MRTGPYGKVLSYILWSLHLCFLSSFGWVLTPKETLSSKTTGYPRGHWGSGLQISQDAWGQRSKTHSTGSSRSFSKCCPSTRLCPSRRIPTGWGWRRFLLYYHLGSVHIFMFLSHFWSVKTLKGVAHRTRSAAPRRAMSLKFEHIVFYVCTHTGGIIRRLSAAPSNDSGRCSNSCIVLY